MKTFRNLILAVPVLWLMAGCKNGPETPQDYQPVSQVDPWWNNPGSVQDHLAAVGVSPLLNKRAVASSRQAAEVDGRAKLAATLKAQIQSLAENWSKDVGDLTNEASFSSYVNNESFTRQFVNDAVKGAQAYKYHQDEGNVYVLMVLRDPTQWVENLATEIRDQALQDETLWKTEVMKQDFRKRMDDMVNTQKDKVSTTALEKIIQASQGAGAAE